MSLWFGGNRASVLRALRACEKPHKAVAHFAIYEKSEKRDESVIEGVLSPFCVRETPNWLCTMSRCETESALNCELSYSGNSRISTLQSHRDAFHRI